MNPFSVELKDVKHSPPSLDPSIRSMSSSQQTMVAADSVVDGAKDMTEYPTASRQHSHRFRTLSLPRLGGTGSRRFNKKKEPRLEKWFKILFTFSAGFALILPVIIGYALHIPIISSNVVALGLGFYGLFVVLHYFVQGCFAQANRVRVNRLVRNRPANWRGLATGVLIVGYREDPELYRQCLESCKALQYDNLRRIIMVVDGDEKEDEYMGTIFQEVFGPDATVIVPGFNMPELGSESPEAKALYTELRGAKGPICILQKHGGKRHAMYCGFHVFLSCIPTDAIMVTDSDTYLDCNAVKELAFMLDDPKVGAATGDVRIWNDDNWISFLSALRYWGAFNVERACQSFHKCVGCVSGPLGIYRTEIIREIIEPWVSQKFLGVQCTYGDDRHLTNLTLKLGQQVVYTHYAWCLTETPTQFIRWIVQQTRWSKSFYREALFNARWFHRHSLWMAYELLFQFIYPWILMYAFFTVLYNPKSSLRLLLTWANILLLMGFLKSLYAVVITKNVKFLLVTFYGFLYLHGLMLAKIHAILFLWDNGWGTSSRFGAKMSKWQQYVFPIIWNLAIFAGVGYNIARFFLGITVDPLDLAHPEHQIILRWVYLGTFCGAIVLGILGYNIYKCTKRKRVVGSFAAQA